MSQKAVSDLIPAQASSSNQLADKNFVNSSITTATATYQGSYNLVSDLELTISASHGQIEQALNTAATGAYNNDYSFVQIPTSDSTPTEIASVERYKYNGTTWSYEYAINNSGFTAAQWAAVNSNITSGLVAQLNALSGNPQTSISKLFGMDASGNFQNISTSDLASVLGVNSNIRSYYRSTVDRYVCIGGYFGKWTYSCISLVIQLSVWNGTPINELAYIRNNADYDNITNAYFGCSSDVKDLLYYKESNYSLWIKIPANYIGSLIVIPVQGSGALFTVQTDATGLTKIV